MHGFVRYFYRHSIAIAIITSVDAGFCTNACALLALKNLPLATNLAVMIMLPVSAITGHTIASYMHRYRRKILSAEIELERLANTDSLTGVANRKEFLRVSEMEIVRHQRLGKQLSMLVLDLNHFNQISNTSGAQTADIVLVEVSKRVKRVTRNYDCLARYGLEEFCVLLPEASLDVAQRIAVRAMNTIAAIPVAVAGQELKVSASAGVATLMAGDTTETLYERAMQAMQNEKILKYF